RPRRRRVRRASPPKASRARTTSSKCLRSCATHSLSARSAASSRILPRRMHTLQETPLHGRHVALGARMVAFAGYDMPVQYEGVIPEHRAVRERCGVFDVSHMGELMVEGPNAAELLQQTLSNDLRKLGDGDAQYSLLTNERGGIVDDVIVYRLSAFRFLVV